MFDKGSEYTNEYCCKIIAYGNTIVKSDCKFEKADFNHKSALDLNFLQTCQSVYAIPKFLQFHITSKSL